MKSGSKFAIIVAILVAAFSATYSRAEDLKQNTPIVKTNYSYEDAAIVVTTIGKGRDIVCLLYTSRCV